MEIRYQSDLYGSYLLIPADNMDHSKYTYKMLEKNKIKGVLPYKERMEDGQTYLHIDITGKKNLYQEYQEKEMNLQEMTFLFQSLISIFERLRDYLLTEKMVILEPEYIYKEMEEDSFFVLVLPWEIEEKAPLRKLAEFFLEKVTNSDENGVSAAYHFYRMQSQPQFSIYQFLTVLEKENILSRQKNTKEQNDQKNETIINVKEVYKEESEKNLIYTIEEEKDLSLEKSSKIFIICIILSITILIFCFLPFAEKNQKISCLGLSIILFIFGTINKVITYKEQKHRQKTENELPDNMVEIGEETAFISESIIKDNLKLQWKERGRKKTVEIDLLPFTIGKKKDQVSLVLTDSSVSRIHCRIEEQEGQPVLIDMDSTNGTYLNGIRVKKGEMLEIVKNDEILVGKVKILVV